MAEPPEAIGVLGLLKAMRDPDVKVGLGFMVGMAEILGNELQAEQR